MSSSKKLSFPNISFANLYKLHHLANLQPSRQQSAPWSPPFFLLLESARLSPHHAALGIVRGTAGARIPGYIFDGRDAVAACLNVRQISRGQTCKLSICRAASIPCHSVASRLTRRWCAHTNLHSFSNARGTPWAWAARLEAEWPRNNARPSLPHATPQPPRLLPLARPTAPCDAAFTASLARMVRLTLSTVAPLRTCFPSIASQKVGFFFCLRDNVFVFLSFVASFRITNTDV